MKKEDYKNVKISICVPAYGTVTATWLISYMKFMQDAINKFSVTSFIHEQQPVSVSRNILVDMALTKDPDYILFVDADNIIPPGTIEKLIDTMEKTEAEFVTATYFSKQPPYYPVIRQYKSGGFWKVDNPALGQQFEIGGAGFGCCLIKKRVFAKLQKPYFKFSHETWGRKDITLSEDLYFCRQMIATKQKMVCDTSVVCPHVGGAIDVMEYMNFAPIRQSTMMDREELLKDLRGFTGRTENEVDLDVMVGPGLMKEAWEKAKPSTFEEQKKFYKETDRYLYDLSLWHFSDRRKWDIELATKMNRELKDKPDLKVLDLGCGIGQNSIMLARLGCKMTLADLDSVTLGFAEHRFKEHEIPYKIWKTDLEDMPPEEKYDYILALDLFEHLPIEEMKKYADKIEKLKHKGTKVIMTNSFGQDSGGVVYSHPMHYDEEEGHKDIINKIKHEGPDGK